MSGVPKLYHIHQWKFYLDGSCYFSRLPCDQNHNQIVYENNLKSVYIQ